MLRAEGANQVGLSPLPSYQIKPALPVPFSVNNHSFISFSGWLHTFILFGTPLHLHYS